MGAGVPAPAPPTEGVPLSASGRHQIFPGVAEYEIPTSLVEDLLGMAHLAAEPKGIASQAVNLSAAPPERADVLDAYDEYLTTLSRDYGDFAGCRLTQREELLLVRGSSGSVILEHYDQKWDRYRIASSVSYLNPGSYEGGSLFFPRLSIEYRPTAPSTVFFPSTIPYLHKTSSVKSGLRVTVRTFWNDLPPEEEHPRVRHWWAE